MLIGTINGNLNITTLMHEKLSIFASLSLKEIFQLAGSLLQAGTTASNISSIYVNSRKLGQALNFTLRASRYPVLKVDMENELIHEKSFKRAVFNCLIFN